jgi:hypothetical protein
MNLWIGRCLDHSAFDRIDASILANANRQNFKFESVIDRLDALSVRDLFKDREGNLWVCLETGLQLLRDRAAVRVLHPCRRAAVRERLFGLSGQ